MRDVFLRINASVFCRGESDDGWRATFDWALKPSSIAKVVEGNYDRVNGVRRMGRTGAPAPEKYENAGVEQRDEMGRAS